jgi:hypothetical protein
VHAFELYSSKYLSSIGLQVISDSKLFNTFFLLCIALSDSIPSLTFLYRNLFSTPSIRVFSQSISFLQSTLCLAKPPSSIPIRSFAVVNRLLFMHVLIRQSHLTFMFFLSHFESLNNLDVSPTYTAFLHLHIILYTTDFCFSPSGSGALFLRSLTFVPGLKAVRNECRAAKLF